jgi:hypothetical protein
LLIDGFVRQLVRLISTAGVDDLWETVKEALVDSPGVLKTNNIVVAYRHPDSSVKAYEVGYHSRFRPFGIAFSHCGGLDCPQRGQRAHITGLTRVVSGMWKARIMCVACGWKSKWVRQDALKDLVYPVHRDAPSLFYRTFPLNTRIIGLFSQTADTPGVTTSSMDID